MIDLSKISLRKAELDDAKLLFNWANDHSVRTNSINQEIIIWENHLNWFSSKLNSSQTELLILEIDAIPLGQIRIDLVDDYWVIDYSIDIQYRGLGLGKEMVKILIENFKNYSFKAIVRKENSASISVFNRLGFEELPSKNANFKYYLLKK